MWNVGVLMQKKCLLVIALSFVYLGLSFIPVVLIATSNGNAIIYKYHTVWYLLSNDLTLFVAIIYFVLTVALIILLSFKSKRVTNVLLILCEACLLILYLINFVVSFEKQALFIVLNVGVVLFHVILFCLLIRRNSLILKKQQCLQNND